jgi:hypothetical protein
MAPDTADVAEVGSRIPTVPQIPPKFTRQSHLSVDATASHLLSAFGSNVPVGSIPIARSILRQRRATQGYKIGVKTLIRWKSLGKSTLKGRRSHGVTYPALPRDSHVQPHAAVHKNKLCDSHDPLVTREIAGGWTRPKATVTNGSLSAA